MVAVNEVLLKGRTVCVCVCVCVCACVHVRVHVRVRMHVCVKGEKREMTNILILTCLLYHRHSVYCSYYQRERRPENEQEMGKDYQFESAWSVAFM